MLNISCSRCGFVSSISSRLKKAFMVELFHAELVGRCAKPVNSKHRISVPHSIHFQPWKVPGRPNSIISHQSESPPFSLALVQVRRLLFSPRAEDCHTSGPCPSRVGTWYLGRSTGMYLSSMNTLTCLLRGSLSHFPSKNSGSSRILDSVPPSLHDKGF